MSNEESARRDATLTVGVLAVVGVLALVLGAPLSLTALALGVGATVAAELLLSLRAAWVRSVWARREIQAGAVVVGIGGGIALAVLVGRWTLTALVAALLTYLLVLSGSVVWRRTLREPND